MNSGTAIGTLRRMAEEFVLPHAARAILLQQIALAVAAALFVAYLGPAPAVTLTLGALLATAILLGPPRFMLSTFIIFMIASHQFRSFVIVPFGGIEWHPREFLLFLLLAHWAVKVIQGKVRFPADPLSLAFALFGLFFVQITIVGVFSQPDLHHVIAECRSPIFLASYIVFMGLVQDRADLRFYIRVVFGLTLIIAVASIAFFAYTLATGNLVNTQNALGEFIHRPIGPALVQSIRPNGHMFFEVGIVVLASLVFCRDVPRQRRAAYLMFGAVLGLALLITMMRTAYVALAVSLGLLVLISIPNRLAQVLLVGLACALALVALLVVGPLLLDQAQEALPGLGTSVEGRLVEVAGAWRSFLEHPILGAGMGSSFKEIGYAEKTSQLAYAQATYSTVHNVWMGYLFKGGFVGLLLMALGAAGLFARGYALIPSLPDAADRALLRGLVAGLGGQFVAALAMPRLSYPGGYVFLSMIGCCFVVLGTAAGPSPTPSPRASDTAANSPGVPEPG